MNEENLKIVYQEVNELHKYQQEGIDLVYNKLNWILVSDIVFLAALYGFHRTPVIVLLLVSISAIISLIAFAPKKFNHTVKISDQLSKIDDEHFLHDLTEMKRKAINANRVQYEKLTTLQEWAARLLIIAILLECVPKLLILIFR